LFLAENATNNVLRILNFALSFTQHRNLMSAKNFLLLVGLCVALAPTALAQTYQPDTLLLHDGTRLIGHVVFQNARELHVDIIHEGQEKRVGVLQTQMKTLREGSELPREPWSPKTKPARAPIARRTPVRDSTWALRHQLLSNIPIRNLTWRIGYYYGISRSFALGLEYGRWDVKQSGDGNLILSQYRYWQTVHGHEIGIGMRFYPFKLSRKFYVTLGGSRGRIRARKFHSTTYPSYKLGTYTKSTYSAAKIQFDRVYFGAGYTFRANGLLLDVSLRHRYYWKSYLENENNYKFIPSGWDFLIFSIGFGHKCNPTKAKAD
jgi:hypothetical protein